MSLYHIVFFGLLLAAVAEHYQKKTPKWLFAVAFAALTAMICLRFGQGTDYFSYASIYHSLPANPFAALDAKRHTEPGWKFLCAFCKMLGVPYPIFILILSLGMMLLFLRFLNRYCDDRKLLALVIFYHTLYLSYFMSILRQALVIAVFLGALLPWLQNRKYIWYYLITVLLMTIHSVSAILLLVPLLRLVNPKFKYVVAFVAGGFLLGGLFSVIDIGLILKNFIKIPYFSESEISPLALLERIITFAVVAFCCYLYFRGKEIGKQDWVYFIFKVYAVGICLYGVLMWSPLISSRTVYILKVLEILLICTCISKCRKISVVVLSYFLLLSSVLYVKNVDSYLEQGQYKNAGIVNYPYVTIFDEEEILNYREDTINYPFEKDK